jgi:hypothetical protein
MAYGLRTLNLALFSKEGILRLQGEIRMSCNEPCRLQSSAQTRIVSLRISEIATGELMPYEFLEGTAVADIVFRAWG